MAVSLISTNTTSVNPYAVSLIQGGSGGLIEKPDGTVIIIPKSPAYVFGEQLRYLAESVYNFVTEFASFFDFSPPMVDAKEIVYIDADPMIPNNFGNIFYSDGNYEDAAEQYQIALKRLKEVHIGDPNHPHIGSALNNLGNTFYRLHKYEKAAECQREALEIHRKNDDPTKLAKTLNTLGDALYQLGRYKEALPHYEEAISIQRTPLFLNNLGTLLHTLKQCEPALSYYEEALEIRRRIGAPSIEIAHSSNNLANALLSLERYDESITAYKEALDIYRQVHEDPYHSDIVMTLTNLGSAHANSGQHDTSFIYYQKSLVLSRDIYAQDPHYDDLAGLLNNLGQLFCDLKDYDKAVSYYEEALEILGKEHPRTPLVQENLNACLLINK